MKCFKAKGKLSAYIDDELSQPWRAKIEEHLKKCTSCNEHLKLLMESHKILDIWEEISPAENFVEKFRRQIKELERQQITGKPFGKRRVLSYVAASLILFLGLFSGLYLAHLIYPGENGASQTEEIAQIDRLLYLETFDDIPPDSVGGIDISLNSGTNRF